MVNYRKQTTLLSHFKSGQNKAKREINHKDGKKYMKLIIDGRETVAHQNQTLLQIITEMGFINGKLSHDPIVAKIAGEVFTLNYVPTRKRRSKNDKPSLRKAIEASNGKVTLLRYSDPLGMDAYKRTAQFILFAAIKKLWPESEAQMNCTVGSGLYIKVANAKDFNIKKLKVQIAKMVSKNVSLKRKTIPTEEAIEFYRNQGQFDKSKLLEYRTSETFSMYHYGDFADYFYGEMAPSTGFLKVWDILPAPNGFMFIFPDALNPDKLSNYKESPNFFNVYTEGKQWGELMKCQTVADLNEMVDNGRIRTLIQVNEALHEKRFSQIADAICQRGAKIAMLAGPSSSGKTTSANRLATQLRVHGKNPILMSLDDYYLDRDKIAPGPDGSIDLEHINTIDTELFAKHLTQLLKGEEVELPTFNFKIEKREWLGHKLRLDESTVIIVEGLHALNPVLLPKDADANSIVKIYVSPLLALNLDNHNRIPSSYLRLLRRTVRDYETRNSSVQKTLSMWDSVRRGEERWIFPFQEQADFIFNSSTLYEVCILKRHIFPLLNKVEPCDDCYDEVRSMVKFLNFIHEADVDDEIPPTSLVREFIGGNTFYLK